MSLKKITFIATTIVSNIIIRVPVFTFLLYALIILANRSDPPVDPLAFNTTAVPTPTNIDPYINANTLSFVIGLIFSKTFKKYDSDDVPSIVFNVNLFPNFKKASTNSGIFKIIVVVPTGILHK